MNVNSKLMRACEAADPKAIRQALDQGADVNFAEPEYGWTPLMNATVAESGSVIKSVRLLLDRGADPSRALNTAANGAEAQVVKLLLDYDADPHVRGKDGLAPLHSACENIQTENVELLLSRGAEVDVRDADGWTPLMWAAHWDERAVQMLELLLNADADPNAQSKDGWTPALLAQWPEILEPILKAGGDVNQGHGQFNFTPLMGAFIRANLKPARLIEAMLPYDPDPTPVLKPANVTYKPKGVLARNTYDDLRPRVRKRVGRTALEMARDKASKDLLRSIAAT